MKNVKIPLLTAIVTAVLCAGTVSARQLYQTSTATTCGGSCTKHFSCPNILGCECIIAAGDRIGTCELVAAKPAH